MLALVALCASVPPPNIVLILADDLGYGDLGCYGQKWIKTPELDRLARSGIRFTQAYSGSTVCAPSRDCLMTGRDTGHCWMRGNGSVKLRPDPEDVTIASLLRRRGYVTATIGKSSVQCDSEDPAQPARKGFDFFFGDLTHIAAHFHYPEKLWKNETIVKYPTNRGQTGTLYDGDLFLVEALSFIGRASKNKPFFLMYASTLPHAGITVPERWKAPYKGKFEEMPFEGGHYSACADPKATYAGMVAHLDYECGEIARKLKARGLDRNTVVVFASDNGGAVEGGYHAPDLNSNGGLRGTKRDLYEGGIRVPLIVSWPGRVTPKRTSGHVCSLIDLFASFVDFAQLPQRQDLQSISLAPTLLGAGRQRAHEYLYWEFHELGGKRAVRIGRWKAVQLQVGKDRDGPVELFDLALDPAEKVDVSGSHPDFVERARSLFASSRTKNPLFNFDHAGEECCGPF